MGNKIFSVSNFGIAADAIQNTEYFYKQIIQQLPGAFYISDVNGKVIFYNQAAEHLWGQKPDEEKAWGFGFKNIYYPDNDTPLKPNEYPMARMLKEGKTIEGEEILAERTDGLWKYILTHPKALFNVSNELIGGINILVDITARKEAEQVIKERLRLLEDMFSSSHDCIKVLDLEGLLISMNESGQRIAEIDDLTPFIGAAYADLWGDAKEDAIQALEDARNGGTGRFVGWLPTLKTLAPKWWDIMITPIPGSNGKPERLLVVARDITEYTFLQEELKERNQELLKINNDLDNFIYTASHDLRLPITNIEGLVNTLKSTLEEVDNTVVPEASTMLNMIDKSINRFKRTIIDLTEISKVQRTNEEDVLRINCAEIIEDVILSIQDQITTSDADIRVDTHACNNIIFSTKNFKSIVYNLLSNAVKYRHPDRKPEITIRTEIKEQHLLLSIQDNGLGINETHLPKLFSMFKRFHNHVDGTGIGLYIIKRIIDNAGGTIEVKSELNKGTLFNVYFKL